LRQRHELHSATDGTINIAQPKPSTNRSTDRRTN
jgi:hypothetical protein